MFGYLQRVDGVPSGDVEATGMDIEVPQLDEQSGIAVGQLHLAGKDQRIVQHLLGSVTFTRYLRGRRTECQRLDRAMGVPSFWASIIICLAEACTLVLSS